MRTMMDHVTIRRGLLPEQHHHYSRRSEAATAKARATRKRHSPPKMMPSTMATPPHDEGHDLADADFLFVDS